MTAWLLEEPTWLYRAYDAPGRLLYVGIAADVEQRMDGHQEHPWYGAIAALEVELYPDRRQAAAAETEAIAAEWPLWNIQNSPWGSFVRDQVRQLTGYWRQDKWGRWHLVPRQSWPRNTGPLTAAEKRRLDKQLAHHLHVRRLTCAAIRAYRPGPAFVVHRRAA